MAEADRPVGAYYTVRRWDAARRELTMLMVRHGDRGPASAWIDRAAPGDPLALWGPRTAYHPSDDTDWHLLVADDTGLPAVAVILESLPPGAVARVFAEVADASEQQELRGSDDVDVTWLYRGAAPAGTTTLLADAVRAMPMARWHALRVGRRREQGDDRGSPVRASRDRPAARCGLARRLLAPRHQPARGLTGEHYSRHLRYSVRAAGGANAAARE